MGVVAIVPGPMAATAGRQELPHPVLQAMLVCDHAIREIGTNKVTLVGIFDRIWSSTFPIHWVKELSVYARVTDAEGEYQIRLELVRLDDEQAIGQGDGTVTIADRMSSTELIFNLDALVFERPGRYEFRLFAEGRHVGGQVLNVVQVAQPQGGADE